MTLTTRILDIGNDATVIDEAVAIVRSGGLVAFPTETVYGLGGDASRDDTVAAIFAAKNRPDFNPLIIHFPDREAAEKVVEFDDRAKQLAHAFWPGALTLVLPRRDDAAVSLLASAGLDSLAVRVPDHPVAQRFLKAAGVPIAAPSANASGEISPTTAAHVAQSLDGRVGAILDDGPCRVGLESTVIDLTTPTPTLLRPGGISLEDIEAVIGTVSTQTHGEDGAPKSPGMLARHYAPRIPIRINAEGSNPGEALLAFGPDAPKRSLNLSRSGDLSEAAANLFSMMRMLDQPGIGGIAVMKVPDTGLGRAINDRLRRAAEV